MRDRGAAQPAVSAMHSKIPANPSGSQGALSQTPRPSTACPPKSCGLAPPAPWLSLRVRSEVEWTALSLPMGKRAERVCVTGCWTTLCCMPTYRPPCQLPARRRALRESMEVATGCRAPNGAGSRLLLLKSARVDAGIMHLPDFSTFDCRLSTPSSVREFHMCFARILP